MSESAQTNSTERRGGGLVLSDIVQIARRRPDFDGHEEVWLGEDRRRCLTAIVAIHNSVLGPGLGGTRFYDYANRDAALDDVLRLSRGMTYKAAIAGLPFGGGKAVIVTNTKSRKGNAMLEAYAEMLARLRGRFVTAEDVGMTIADADFLRARTDYISGTTIGGSGNPAPFTASGVFKGMEAAAAFAFGSGNLDGHTVSVQGLGSVGMNLCRLLHKAGARLKVADLAADRVDQARAEFAAEPVVADAIIAAEAEIFAPCALGAVLNRESIPHLGARVVAGSANNVLAKHGDAARLMERGILYAPDYVINAGGLINVAAELGSGGYARRSVVERIELIPETLRRIFVRARDENLPTNEIARRMAMERIEAVGKEG
jgi:leucine dehydrogenase